MGKDIKKILITGGAGFIGSNVARNLLQNGYEVSILDNFLPQIHGDKNELSEDLKGRVKLIYGDVADPEVLYAALQDQHAVIHYAAETGTGQSMYNIAHYTNINIQATANLCEYIINEKHAIQTVVVASSRSIYGEGKYNSKAFGNVYPNGRTYQDIKESFDVSCPISGNFDLELMATDEDSAIHPSSFYGITKQVQEQMVILACRLKGINGFALRYQNVYGPGQSLKNPYTGILSIFSRLALQNEEINIFEDGLESRDFVYIDDVVKATIKCLDQNITGQYILNVGSGVPVSVIEVAEEIVDFLKSSSVIKISGAFREGDIRHNYADLKLAKQIINFQPDWSFKKGLHQFLAWVLEQKDIPSNTSDYKRSLGELKEKGLLNV
ncbi:NAD-dependent epimerase/dehydratase family protein [Pedobacter foliorum]|uniref:NAD-dependent epimerase/dehydratase family protein n=1 Tax=Pedobacter foliorum TaxID=2739058 RepID=UPI001562F71F|nr:NAD-dependent epimerase/dehydratase family protein [Pedobacter foliorum]NRF39157.1 NAD-dependent epimerase/dehydratase family protein [Pedobacter foliorum]